jgi:tRNA threonylcarbamoyladenosine dehydratase
MIPMDESYLYRFGGIARLYGKGALLSMSKARVMVVGLGGVGSWAVEALARSGVGQLTLVDFDDICVSNTNRQLHALTQNVGKMKAQVLADRVAGINPQCEVELIEMAFTTGQEDLFFQQDYDVVIDAIDSSKNKVALLLACHQRGVPLIIVGSAGGRQDPTLVRVADLSQTREDPMLALVRKSLRQKAGFPRQGSMGYKCIFSLEKPKYVHGESLEPSTTKPDNFNKPLDCATGFGTCTPVTGTFGFWASHLAVQSII